MPAQTRIAADAIGRFSRAASVEMRKSRSAIGVPKNSATIAWICVSVASTLGALKTSAIANGLRSNPSVRHQAAPTQSC